MLALHTLIASEILMATLTIRNVDENLKSRLRLEAALHGHSMEEEVRSILRRNLTTLTHDKGLGERIHRRFANLRVVELELPKRQDKPRAVDFE